MLHLVLEVHELMKRGEKDHFEYQEIRLPAEILKSENDLFTEGRLLYVEGSIRTRSSIDQMSIKRYTAEIYVKNYVLIT